MLKKLSRFAALFVLLFAVAACDDAPKGANLPQGQYELSFERVEDGSTGRFVVEEALTPDQWMRGLMYREEMAADAGMIFVFDKAHPQMFWMKNTLIPLDIVFIDEKGVIFKIHENAKPLDLTPIESIKPAKAVLEINGGAAKTNNLQVGDKILYKSFSKALAAE